MPSLTLVLDEGLYDILYRLKGYYDNEFTIRVEPQVDKEIEADMLQPEGELYLASFNTMIPGELYLEEEAHFQFQCTNSLNGPAYFATQLVFIHEGEEEDLIFEFPDCNPSESIACNEMYEWRDFRPGESKAVFQTIIPPLEMVPEGTEEIDYNVYIRLYGEVAE